MDGSEISRLWSSWAHPVARTLHLTSDDMSRRTVAAHDHQQAPSRTHGYLRRGDALLAVGIALLLAFGGPSAAAAHAAASHAVVATQIAARLTVIPGVRSSEQYVFTIGIVDFVGADAITLSFEDGGTETYRLNGATTIQTQNGDALRLADLDIGQMVIVIAAEQDSMAVTIVSGGDAGFHAAGPNDIRGHDDGMCASCAAHAP